MIITALTLAVAAALVATIAIAQAVHAQTARTAIFQIAGRFSVRRFILPPANLVAARCWRENLPPSNAAVCEAIGEIAEAQMPLRLGRPAWLRDSGLIPGAPEFARLRCNMISRGE